MKPLRKILEWFGASDADINESKDAFEIEFNSKNIPENKKSHFKYLFGGEFTEIWDGLSKNVSKISESEKAQIKDILARSDWMSATHWQLYGRYLGYIIGMFRFKPEQVLDEGSNFLIWFEILKRKKDAREFVKFVKSKGIYWIWYVKETSELISTKERKAIYEKLKAAIESL